MQLASGGPKQPTTDAHETILIRETIVNNTKILRIWNDSYTVSPSSKHALLIRKIQPFTNN